MIVTDPIADDLRELGPEALTDPDFPRRGGALPAPDVRFVRTRYRLFKRDSRDGAWVCQCGLVYCRRRRYSWQELSGAYALWLVPVADARRVVRVLRATGVHFGAAPDRPSCPCECHDGCGHVHPFAPCACRARDEAASAAPAVVSNYSDLTDLQREALLKGAPNSARRVARPTADALLRRGLVMEDRVYPGNYLLTVAGMRARAALERGEVPDPPGLSGSRAPRTWGADDPEPAEDGLEIADRDGDVWRRHGGRWLLVEWASGRPVTRSLSEDGAAGWSEVREYGPLTERPRGDRKRARPAEADRSDFREELAELHGAVSQFFTGRASLRDLRRARDAAARALDLVPGRLR